MIANSQPSTVGGRPLTAGRVVVDAHAHVFRPVSVSPRGVDALAPADRDAPVARLLSTMDAYGVAAAVLVPLDAHDEYVAEALRERGNRFAAVAVADDAVLGRTSADPVGALLARRERWGFRAVRTGWLGEPGRPIGESPFLPVLRYLAGAGLPLWSYLPPPQLPLLEQAVVAVPELVVVLNHLGFTPVDMRVDDCRRPWFVDPFPEPTRAALRRLSRFEQVNVMFSGQYALSRLAPPYPDLGAVVTTIAEGFGPARMLWGSDFPWPAEVPGYGTLLDLPRAMLPGVSAADLDLILGGTALRLFPHLVSERSTFPG